MKEAIMGLDGGGSNLRILVVDRKTEQELYSKDEFKEYGIDLYFIKMDNIEYKQFSNEFIPNLSIIDVLMHNGKEGTKELLNRYTLVWWNHCWA